MHTEHLRVQVNLPDPDRFYNALLEMHRDLSPAQSEQANARLVLLLANHIGDPAVLQEALSIAREGLRDA